MPSLQHVSVCFEINPFEMASQNINRRKGTNSFFLFCFVFPIAFIFHSGSADFDIYQWCLLNIICVTFSRQFFQNEQFGNNHSDAATGKSAAQLGHMIGVWSEQIPSCVAVPSLALFSPVSVQIYCNFLCTKCPRIIFQHRKLWENVPSKYRKTFSNNCNLNDSEQAPEE